jgi:hypothetical protein
MSQDDVDLPIQLSTEAVKSLIHFRFQLIHFDLYLIYLVLEAIEFDIKFAPGHLSIFETFDPASDGS